VTIGTPAACLFGLALAFSATRAGVAAGWLPEVSGRVVGLAAAHGGLLAMALAWTRADRGVECGEESLPFGRALTHLAPAGMLALASAASYASPVGSILYLTVPLLVWNLGQPSLITLTPSIPALGARALLVGGLVGAVLGAHLLVSASRTLGHLPRLEVSTLLSAVAYDVGANALSAEAFFRGALWRRVYYQRSFLAAVSVSTGAGVVRYLVDPLLPKTLDMAAGAMFYVAVLGVANCWLFRWSGSIVPGYVASVVFFMAYRLLGDP
jgi:hypothetical protein